MKNLLVSSIEEYSGKSALIIALGLILREKGFKVGYFKPLVADDTLKTMEKVDEVFGKARIKGDATIRRIKELVERFIDLKSLEVLKRK